MTVTAKYSVLIKHFLILKLSMKMFWNKARNYDLKHFAIFFVRKRGNISQI